MEPDNSIIDINQIIKLIPHRYPFLLVDRVTKLDVASSIVGIKNISMNEPQFSGHFPDRPVMPGVLIIEAMAQISAILVAKSMDTIDDKEVFFLSIENAKFRKIVEPGDQLILTARIVQNRGSVWKFTSQSLVNEQVAAEASFTAMVRDKRNYNNKD